MVRALGFHCHGLGSKPGQGTEILKAARYSQKKKKRGGSRCSEKHIVNRFDLRRFTGQDKGSPKKINQEVQVGCMVPEEIDLSLKRNHNSFS